MKQSSDNSVLAIFGLRRKIRLQKFIYPVILCSMLVFACNSGKKEQILSKSDLTALLVDLHIVDAASTDYALDKSIGQYDSLTIYTSVFQKYNCTKEMFVKSIEAYTNVDDDLKKIYEDVFNELNRMDKDVTDKTALFYEVDNKLIFEDNDLEKIRGDSINYQPAFEIPLQGTGKYLFDIRIRMLSEDMSVQPKIRAYFYKNEADEDADDRLNIIDFPLSKSNYSRDYQFIVDLEDEEYNFLKLIIPEVSNSDTVFLKNMHISKLKIMKHN